MQAKPAIPIWQPQHPMAEGCVTYYAFGHVALGNSGKLVDSSPYGIHCAVVNNVHISDWTGGPHGLECGVDEGNSDSFETGSANPTWDALIGGPFSLCFIGKDPSSAGNLNNAFNRILNYSDSGAGTCIQAGLASTLSTTRHFYMLEGTGTKKPDAWTATSVSTNGYYHVCFTYDGATWLSYLDGVNDVGANQPSNAGILRDGNLYVAERGNGSFWNGPLVKLAMYNRVLTPSEVAFDAAFPFAAVTEYDELTAMLEAAGGGGGPGGTVPLFAYQYGLAEG